MRLFASSGGRRVWDSGVSFNARNRAQIFINGAKVMVGHFSVNRPRHHLQERTELRMSVVEIYAGPHDLKELCKRGVAFRQSCLVRSPIAEIIGGPGGPKGRPPAR